MKRLAAIVFLCVAACTTDPSTGKRTFNPSAIPAPPLASTNATDWIVWAASALGVGVASVITSVKATNKIRDKNRAARGEPTATPDKPKMGVS